MFDYYKDVESYKEANGYMVDGAWYPRVTKILSIKAKPALLHFYGEAASYKAAADISTKSAAEGTMVHEAAEAILLGKTPEIPPVIVPAIQAFTEFLNNNNIQTSSDWVERRIWSPDHRYAGTIDALALIDGKFGVLDIKTSQGIFRDYNLQTAAYMSALQSQFQNLQTRWILRIDQGQKCLRCAATLRTKGGRGKIRKNGRSSCMPDEHDWSEVKGVIELQEFPYWHGDFAAFLGAKALWEWEEEAWLKKVGYL